MHLIARPLLIPSLIFAGALAVGALAAVPASAAVTAPASSTAAAAPAALAASLCPEAETTTFGPNVCVFTDTMTQSAIQADLNAISTQQVPVSAQFDSNRYAVLFEPGTYGSKADPLVFQVGYYTEVAGLGAMPQDTVVNGAIDVFDNLCGTDSNGNPTCNADDNFWRSLSNLDLNVDLPSSPPAYAPAVPDPGGAGCENSTEMWAVSQATPIRRAIINGSVVFQDYCGGADNYASGGFIADSQVTGDLNFYGNQQYMTRNSSIGGSNGALWNMVYSGVQGAPAPSFSGIGAQNTVLPTSPVTEEQPFLYQDASGSNRVFVPAVQTNSSGTSWSSGSEAGSSLPLSSFFIANPSTSVAAIDVALALGKNLVLTPGVYNLNAPIIVSRPDTVVLGLGFATLVPQKGNAALVVLPNKGVKVSGLMVDAGPVNSPALVSVGTPLPAAGSATDPDTIQDVFFRIGGAETTTTSATVSLLDNASNSIIDDVWAWRADHGNDVGWTENKADTGLVVTGNDVTAYGLAVEHYQKSEVVWSGQGGTDVFFQNELPYDVPSQSVWNESATFTGYPAFQVTNNVKTFKAYGVGSYVVFIDNNNSPTNVTEAFQVPQAPGVQVSNVFGVYIGGNGGLNSIINGTGGAVDSTTNPGIGVPVDAPDYTG
ncbi:MAG: adenylyl cyclase [Trebonia sp.]